MDVKSLYTLIAAADCGSFAEASTQLGLSLSAVSLQLRGLEDEIGITLFDRRSRPPQLTEEGRDFVSRARDVIAHWEALSQSLSRDPARGVLRVGAVHTAVASSVPAALRLLQTERPEVSIRLTTGLSHDLEERLRRRTLDCAIVTEAAPGDSDLISHRVCSEPLVLIAHRDIKGRDVTKILASEPYVRFSRQARVARLIDGELQRRKIAVNSRMEIDTLEAVVSLVRQRLGVSIVPAAAAGNGFPEDIRVRSFGSPPVLRHLAVSLRSDCPKRHLVAPLVEALRGVYGAATAA